MKPEPRAARRHAVVLVVIAAALWWHVWMPAAIVVAFVGWAVLHTRFQGFRRDAFMRFRSRVWPPTILVLVALMIAGTSVYALSSASIEARVLPIALNAGALAVLVVGWRRARAVRIPVEARIVDDLATKGERA